MTMRAIKRRFYKLVRVFFNWVGLGLIRREDLMNLRSKVYKSTDFDFLVGISRFANPNLVLSKFQQSQSQLRQDLFVLSLLNFKSQGFFVEFGATNGIHLSNTYLLEKQYGWRGILCEPGRVWHKELSRNREASIDTECVWKKSGDKIVFNETQQPELSSIFGLDASDQHVEARKKGKTYEVETVSLNDLLMKHGAPRKIDYLSIDTEGSEFDILEAFSFQRYDISVITVEHNYTASREKIERLLSKNGFIKIMEHVSAFDDWYVNKELVESLA